MSAPPLVSVLVATRDRPRLLERCLRGVRAQTWTARELIVADDASRRRAPIERWAGPGSRVIRLRSPRGAAAARNAALVRARGSLIAFLDDDDVWRPEKLALQVEALADPAVQLVHSDFGVIDGEGRRRCDAALAGPRGGLSARQRRVVDLYRLCPVAALRPMPLLSSVVMRAALLRRLGGFDESFKALYYDLDLWLRARRRAGPGALRLLPRPLLDYRVHAAGATGALLDLLARDRPPRDGREWDVLMDNALFGGRFSRAHAYCGPRGHVCRGLPRGFRPVPSPLWGRLSRGAR